MFRDAGVTDTQVCLISVHQHVIKAIIHSQGNIVDTTTKDNMHDLIPEEKIWNHK